MQYIDNYNYMKQQEDNIEDQFEQLVELIKNMNAEQKTKNNSPIIDAQKGIIL